MIDRLNAAPPQDFDTAYIAQQVNAHRKAAELFDGYAEEGENEALKQFAANTLPTIKQHRDEAAKLAH
jgi:putative membrane protein